MANEYDNDNLTMYVYCDGRDCPEHLELNGEYLECIQEVKDEEWHITKNEDTEEWEHWCPRCWGARGARGVFN